MIIRMFDENRDIDDFLELYRIAFAKPMSMEYFNWKYTENPFKRNIHPIIVAEDYCRLVGIPGVVFSRMVVEGDTVYVTHGSDTAVHFDFRGQGIHLNMVRFG